MPKKWRVQTAGKQNHSHHLYQILLQLRNGAVLLPNRLPPPHLRTNRALHEESVKMHKDEMNKENFFLCKLPIVCSATALERRHKALDMPAYLLGYHMSQSELKKKKAHFHHTACI